MKTPFMRVSGLLFWMMGLVILVAFSTCQKDDNEPEPINLPELPGMDYLGRGYNAFGEFASTDELKATLLEFEQFRKEKVGDKEYKIPEEADVQYLDANTYQTIYGAGIEEYQNQRILSVGLSTDQPFFSGSVMENFLDIHYRTRDYAFVNITNERNLWKITLPHDPALLREMLTEQARAGLANMSAGEIFNKYGTHVLLGATIGGRADYFAAVRKNQITANMNLANMAEAAFQESLGELDLSGDPLRAEQVHAFRAHSFIALRVQGGDEECGKDAFSPGNYSNWLASVREEPALSGLPNPSLMPVWELCATPERRAALAEAFNQYAAGFELPPIVTDAKTSITDLRVRSGSHEDPYYYQESGFKVIPLNLNDGTTGDYVYLMYKEGLDVEQSITGLATVSGVNPTAPPGWSRVEGNLNAGTGSGDPEIYLCYQRDFTDNPVRQIRIIKGEDTPLPEGFEFVTNFYFGNIQDLNKGAGGSALFLAFSRNTAQP